jgi:hypothetical protein
MKYDPQKHPRRSIHLTVGAQGKGFRDQGDRHYPLRPYRMNNPMKYDPQKHHHRSIRLTVGAQGRDLGTRVASITPCAPTG